MYSDSPSARKNKSFEVVDSLFAESLAQSISAADTAAERAADLPYVRAADAAYKPCVFGKYCGVLVERLRRIEIYEKPCAFRVQKTQAAACF